MTESGRDVGRFFGDLEAHARALMVVQTLGGEVPPELAVTPEQDERLREQASRVSPGDVVRLLDLIAAALRAMKDGSDARTQLELTLVKAAVPAHEASVQALLARLERLESGGGGGNAGGAAGGGTLSPPASRAPSVPATAAGRAATSRTSVAVTATVSEPSANPAEPDPTVTAVAVIEPDAPTPKPSVTVGIDLDLASLSELWPAVIENAQAENRLVGAVLAHARPTALEGDELTLALVGKTNKALAEDPVKRELIAKAVRSVTGSSLRLAYELRADVTRDESDTPTLSADEMIERLMKEFEAEELPPEPEPESEPEETP